MGQELDRSHRGSILNTNQLHLLIGHKGEHPAVNEGSILNSSINLIRQLNSINETQAVFSILST